jgi:RNA polymerase sigma factor (sigma-70 family)
MAIAEVFRHLRRTALLSADLTDGQLLECYLTRQEAAAFEALVRRHGPMVLGVCRRILRNEHDAEDAFQATFLVLLRKATSILPRDRVGNWLYGVAYRTSLKAKAMRAKRRAKERQVTRPETDHSWLEPLDYELNRLPDKYREPVVLCHLQGKTRRQAARILGWPEGTVATRLATARRMLAKRLSSPMGIPIASVPPLLVASTVRSVTAGQITVSANVAALTGAVLKGMIMSKVKIVVAMVIVLSTIGLGVGAGSYKLLAGEEDRKAPPTEQKAVAKEEGRLPIGPPPTQVLVSLAEEGRLTIKWAETLYEPEHLGVAGKEVVSYRGHIEKHTQLLAVTDIGVLDSKGNPIDKDQLPRLLKEEMPALIYSGPSAIDPLHLRLIKEGTLVFVLPYAPPVPPRAPPQGIPLSPVVSYILPPGVLPPGRDKENRQSDKRVGRIFIVGNEQTSQDLVLKAIQLSPGQRLTDANLRKAEQNLKRLNLFESVTVTVVETQSDLKDVLVVVKEK